MAALLTPNQFTGFLSPFYAIGLFLQPVKTSENKMFSGVIENDQWHEMSYNGDTGLTWA